MTDAEIKKALEVCASKEIRCNECPFDEVCANFAIKDLLAFINRQNAEIERLKEENEKVNKEVDQLSQGLPKFKTGDYAKIVNNRSDHQFKIGTIVKLEKYDTGYKAFANGDYWWVEDSELTEINDDNLVKEMVGEG